MATRTILCCAAVLITGCQTTTYATVRNGGFVQSNACEGVGIRVGQPVSVVPASSATCREATVTGTAPGVTYALWQLTGDTEWSGPTPSNVARVELVTDAQSGGESAPSDTEGASTSANAAPEPVPPGGHATSPFSIRKSASRESARAGETIEFHISVVNLSRARVDRIVLVDRVDSWVALEDAGTATAHPGPLGTTVLVWDETTGLLPDEERSFQFRVRARSRAERAAALQSSPAPEASAAPSSDVPSSEAPSSAP